MQVDKSFKILYLFSLISLSFCIHQGELELAIIRESPFQKNLSVVKDVAKSFLPKNDDLKYYHHYEATRGISTPNVHAPLKVHYNNEANLRKESYILEDKLHQIKRRAARKINFLDHKLDYERNKALKLASLLSAQERLGNQKKVALETEMDHEEKEREFYDDRLAKNIKKERKALPDQQAKFNKLSTFDRDQAKDYSEELKQNQYKLDELKQDSMKETTDIEEKIDAIKMKINALKNKMRGIGESAKVQVSSYKNKAEILEKQIKNDEKLDKSRENLTNKSERLINMSKNDIVEKSNSKLKAKKEIENISAKKNNKTKGKGHEN